MLTKAKTRQLKALELASGVIPAFFPAPGLALTLLIFQGRELPTLFLNEEDWVNEGKARAG
jgi:hypothetical protein